MTSKGGGDEMKKKVEVIPNYYVNYCWVCNGKKKIGGKKCKQCDGTGKFIDTHYIMIVGNQAFDMDTIK